MYGKDVMLREEHREGSLLISGAHYCGRGLNTAQLVQVPVTKHIAFAFCNTNNTNLRWQFHLCVVA